jgi:hypothetical protein
MKLKSYSEQTVDRGYSRSSDTPKLTFSKSGQISFNNPAQSLIGLDDNVKITFSQDEDSPEDWYVHIDPQHGFTLRRLSNKQLCFSHSNLVIKFNDGWRQSKNEILVHPY